jgi:superoxide dismutase
MALAAYAAPAAPRSFTPLPLPFDPKAIAGFSEKLLVSHHDNNCVGAVKRLGTFSKQFAALDPATAPGFQLNGLKREELLAWNSMILHELYFAGLGAPTRPGKALATAIERDFGSDARWRNEFTGMGKALAGGSGWVLLTYSHRDNRLVNQWDAIFKSSQLDGVTVHVVRHSFTSVANDLGYTEITMAADTVAGFINGLLFGEAFRQARLPMIAALGEQHSTGFSRTLGQAIHYPLLSRKCL